MAGGVEPGISMEDSSWMVVVTVSSGQDTRKVVQVVNLHARLACENADRAGARDHDIPDGYHAYPTMSKGAVGRPAASQIAGMNFLTADSNEDGGQDVGNAGVFTVGGVNSSLYSGNIEFLGLAAGGNQLGLWMLGITAITVGGKSIDITPNATLAMFDTSSNEIIGPDADVRAIYAAIPGSSEPTETVFQYPCNTTVKVSISFGGQSWDIDPQDMNQGAVQSGSADCFGAFGSVTGTQNPSWRLGIPFLRNVYTVLRQNPPAIGFAELSTVVGGTGAPNATQTNPSSVSASSQSSASGSTPTNSTPSQVSAKPKSKSNVGAIAGGVIAGVAVIILLIVGFILYRRRRQRRTTAPGERGERDFTVSAFPSDMESSAPPLSSLGGSPVVTSPVLSPKRAGIQNQPYGRLASDNYVMTQKGLRLSPGTSPASSSVTSASAVSPSEISSPALPPGAAQPVTVPTDPAILQELQTLRNEVRWLVNERSEPPPIYT
ncbi:aspartic peptidase domain-containing protein [Roridomyces roridus]|uniref:Aspartic peptidase domain-containing protein n=1 Tax=Roridomyces roridus TaxID=1738132 RepID=A0AAD7AYU5_9AGAR|nr:aspartic peptidase domain-containing protein [Roridomyces roridus]